MSSNESTCFSGYHFDPASKQVHPFGPDDLDAELASPATFTWIDLQSENIAELNGVLTKLDIDLQLVSHFGTPEVLPRIVERSDCLAFYLYEIVDPELHLDTSCKIRRIEFGRMILVIGKDFVITYHRRSLGAVDYVKASCEDAFRLAGRTPAFIAFLFLQRCLYDYAHLNLANDNFLDSIGKAVGVVDHDELGEVVAIAGASILTLKKLVASLHIVLMVMGTKRSPFISDEARESFSQMLHNVHATREAVDSSRDMLDGVVLSMQVLSSGRTAEIALASARVWLRGSRPEHLASLICVEPKMTLAPSLGDDASARPRNTAELVCYGVVVDSVKVQPVSAAEKARTPMK